ncbi:hypothetical protein BB561_002335 [Smittium simulii]|uniref:Palmitoyl-protein thioesterase 1 n=1 Tax=Smittium simulii TaxID=133385 RepID=A0A2T9YQU9_9FUNG|nr:hypothetical protein BB561_002335 [Smittium simulii]
MNLDASNKTPVVIWHGLGDSCCEEMGMNKIKKFIQEEIPGTYVYSAQLADSAYKDRISGFYGNINEQIDKICNTLKNDVNIQDEYYGLGFSQGGLFLRALHQRCPYPRMKKLVTFGSPHAGIASPPPCKNSDMVCWGINKALVAYGYTDMFQRSVVPAQYYKSPNELERYLEKSIFLPDINNELLINQTYVDQIKKLEKLVLIHFMHENVLDPKKSSWFSFYGSDNEVISLKNSTLYKDDRLGLKYLDENNRIDFLEIPEMHASLFC